MQASEAVGVFSEDLPFTCSLSSEVDSGFAEWTTWEFLQSSMAVPTSFRIYLKYLRSGQIWTVYEYTQLTFLRDLALGLDLLAERKLPYFHLFLLEEWYQLQMHSQPNLCMCLRNDLFLGGNIKAYFLKATWLNTLLWNLGIWNFIHSMCG